MGGRGGGGGTPRGPAGGGVALAPAATSSSSSPPLDRPDIAADILEVISQINGDRGTTDRDPVNIGQVRSFMPQLERAEFDTAIRQMAKRGTVNISRPSGQPSSSQQSGVLLGGEWKTQIRRS